MIENLFIMIGMVAFFVAVFQAIRWRRSYTVWRSTENRYKLYKVRDHFIFLVADKVLAEDDWLFQRFYTSINAIVRREHLLNMRTLMKALRDEALQTRSTEFRDELLNRLADHPHRAEIRSAVTGLYDAMFEIVIENSLTLRAARKLGKIGHYLQEAWEWTWSLVSRTKHLRWIIQERVYAYEVYSSSEEVLKSVRIQTT